MIYIIMDYVKQEKFSFIKIIINNLLFGID